MKPILFSLSVPWLGRLDFPAYFTLFLMGFFTAIFFGQREAKRRGVHPGHFIDLYILLLISGIIGARLLHVLADGYFWNYVHHCTDPSLVDWGYSEAECSNRSWIWLSEKSRCVPPYSDCLLPLKFWRGGLAFYGGIFLCLPVGLFFAYRKKMGMGNALDLVGLGLPLGLFFGRLGCFFAGCCFGQMCSLPWAVSFPARSDASSQQLLFAQKARSIFPELSQYLPFTKAEESFPVHPTQLYEAFACLFIFLFLYLVWRRRQRFVGDLFCMAILLYAIARFAVEFLRDDSRGVFFGWISTSQLIAIPMALFSLLALWLLPKRLSVDRPLAKAVIPEKAGVQNANAFE
jgi:phosphatidylglycerol:prolipoprotein diacylglycerol transferase